MLHKRSYWIWRLRKMLCFSEWWRILANQVRPGATLAGLADKGVKNVTTAGKILLDLAAGETALVVEGMKEGLRLPLAAGAAAEVLRHRMDTLVGMQKHLLDAAAEETHAVTESYREGQGLIAGAKAAELARRGIEAVVESEKSSCI